MTPGDEVLCTNIKSPCSCAYKSDGNGYINPEIGRHYIVGDLGYARCPFCCTFVLAIRPAGSLLPLPWAWPAVWFTPLSYDEDGEDYVSVIRSLEPC